MTNHCSSNWPEIGRTLGPCIRPGGTVLTERALEICDLPPGSQVADIGCGAGGTLEYLERTGVYRLAGLDHSETILGDAASRLVSVRLVQGRAEALPFENSSFDAIFCECVLSILDDRITALREFARVLKEGGYLILSDVFSRGCPGQERSEEKSERRRTSELLAKDDLLGLLTGIGLSILQWEEHDRLLKEFAVRLILAGERLPDPWGCGPGREGKKMDLAGISYFLLVASKSGTDFQSVGNK